jgi:eukaryotic-like serine/threonine-protein kinase
MIGTTISHYKILDKLGEGGMGVVYKAHDTKLDRTVALKFLPPHLGGDETEKKRFLNEAKAASTLDHPNICTIHSIEETNDRNMFIAMAYYEGMSLKQKIEQSMLPIKDVINYSIQIASGLQKAHEKGIVHRDLKPANIFITNDNQIKIIDFGLARVAERSLLTKSNTTLGTVPYMSPEQAQGSNVDHRTDVWALGVIMYELITGQRPFKSEYETALIYSIINEEPDPVSSIRSNVPMELERIIKKAIQKDQKYRYQSVDELLVDLKSVSRDIVHDGLKGTVSASKINKTNSAGYLKIGIGITIVVALFISLLLFRNSAVNEIRSIAVLPLVNLSGDAEQEYFSDGMTEALITDLAKISALRVISRTSVMQYKNINKPLSDIARELNVDAVVEGAVMRSGQQVRISAQLIEAKTDRHLWANSYTREMSDILLLQSDVARAIADEIKVKLTPQEYARLTEVHHINPDVYELLLKGRYFWNQRTPESLMRAIDFFEQAVSIDPNYAEAYRGLGASYSVLGVFFSDPRDAFSKAVAYMEKSMELDKNVVGGNLGLGVYNMYHAWDRQKTLEYFNREVEYHPGFEHVYNVRGLYLTSIGNRNDAIEQFKKALTLDPLSLTINGDFGWAYYLMRRYDDAITQSREVLEIDPNFILSYTTIAAAQTQKGEYDNAISILESIYNDITSSTEVIPPIFVAELAYAYAKSGNVGKAKQLIQNLELRTSKEYIDPYLISLIYVALDEFNEAFDWLDKALEVRSSRMVWIDVEPKFDPIRMDPRFRTLREKVGYIQ